VRLQEFFPIDSFQQICSKGLFSATSLDQPP